MGLWELAGVARAPRCLRELLRTPWGHLSVVEDALPMSLPQAAIGAVAVLLRARRRTVSGRDGDVEVSRLELAVQRIGGCADAAIGEGWLTWRLALIARSVQALRAAPLPRRAADPQSVLYVRSEPSTTWAGAAIGGAAAHTTGVINGLADNGLEVHVAAADAPQTLLRPRSRRSGRLATTTSSHGLAPPTSPSGSPPPVSRPDFVYQRYALGGSRASSCSPVAGVPLVLEFNGSEVWATGTGPRARPFAAPASRRARAPERPGRHRSSSSFAGAQGRAGGRRRRARACSSTQRRRRRAAGRGACAGPAG